LPYLSPYLGGAVVSPNTSGIAGIIHKLAKTITGVFDNDDEIG